MGCFAEILRVFSVVLDGTYLLISLVKSARPGMIILTTVYYASLCCLLKNLP